MKSNRNKDMIIVNSLLFTYDKSSANETVLAMSSKRFVLPCIHTSINNFNILKVSTKHRYRDS